MPNRRGAVIPGLILVLLGGYLLAQNLGVPLPGFDQLWPGFPLFFGLAFLVRFFAGGRRDDGLMFVGVAGALIGVFFFAFTLGRLEWEDMGRWWPVFVLIGAAAFFAQWMVRPSQRGLLVPAFIALLVGAVFLVVNLRLVNPALAEQLTRLWPVLLILGGLLVLGSYFFGSSRKEG
jgi:hypothetical protein